MGRYRNATRKSEHQRRALPTELDRKAGAANTPPTAPRTPGAARPAWSALAATLLFVAAGTFLAQLPVLDARVLFLDDNQYWVENHLVQNPSWASTVQFFREVLAPSTVKGYYQPLTMVSLMMDWAAGARPDNLRPFHRTNLALHVTNAVLVAALLYGLFGHALAAGLAGLVFGVHPLNVESIAWVVERKTLLATCFALLALLAYVHFARHRAWTSYAATVLAFLLALLAKPTVVPLPLLLLILDDWPLRRLRWQTVLEKLPLFVVAGSFAIIAYVSQARTASVTTPAEVSAWQIISSLCFAHAFYPLRFVAPVDLSAFYPPPAEFRLADPVLLAGVFGTLLLVTLVLISARRTRAIVAGWAFYTLAVLPTVGIVGFTIVFVAAKYFYLPMLGWLLPITAALTQLMQRRWTTVAALAAMLTVNIMLAATTRAYLEHWKENEAFYRHMLTVTPNAAALHNHLGLELKRKERFEEAEAEWKEVLRLDPNSPEGHGNLGGLYSQQGKLDLAIEHLTRAIQLDPHDERAYVNLGNALARQGRIDEAMPNWARGLEINPNNASAHSNYANGLASRADISGAIAHYRTAVRLQPTLVDAHVNLAKALLMQGHADEAMQHAAEALRIKPAAADQLCQIGEEFLAQNQRGAATLMFTEVLRAMPGQARANRGLQAARATSTAPGSPGTQP